MDKYAYDKVPGDDTESLLDPPTEIRPGTRGEDQDVRYLVAGLFVVLVPALTGLAWWLC